MGSDTQLLQGINLNNVCQVRDGARWLREVPPSLSNVAWSRAVLLPSQHIRDTITVADVSCFGTDPMANTPGKRNGAVPLLALLGSGEQHNSEGLVDNELGGKTPQRGLINSQSRRELRVCLRLSA